VSGKISEQFWTRKSEEWEAEQQTIAAEQARLAPIKPGCGGSKRCYRTAPSIATLCPTYKKPFDLFVRATKQENGGVDGTRTRGLRRDRAAF
jgi:hypothetical protein